MNTSPELASKPKLFKDVELNKIPGPVWALSTSALLMTLSAAIVFTIAPHYMVDVLKLNKQSVGWVEGIVESVALMVRMISGSLSDYFVRRKLIILIGYIVSTIAKVGMPFAYTLSVLYVTRITERIGNGLQAAPREALVGDLAPSSIRGACYGIRNAFGKAGSSLGALAVFGILYYLVVDSVTTSIYQFIFLVGILPSFLACIVLYLFVKDKQQPLQDGVRHKPERKPLLKVSELKYLGARFWLVMLVFAVFNFSHFSETFLQLRAREIGVSLVYAPLVMVLMNLTIAVTSYPVGNFSDKLGRKFFLSLGFMLVVLSDLLLAFGTGYISVFVAIMFWGMQMAMTQGMIVALVADTAPENYRGTAFGVLNVLTGVVYLIATPLYGWIWDKMGGHWPFLCSALVTVVALVLLFVIMGKESFSSEKKSGTHA